MRHFTGAPCCISYQFCSCRHLNEIVKELSSAPPGMRIFLSLVAVSLRIGGDAKMKEILALLLLAQANQVHILTTENGKKIYLLLLRHIT